MVTVGRAELWGGFPSSLKFLPGVGLGGGVILFIPVDLYIGLGPIYFWRGGGGRRATWKPLWFSEQLSKTIQHLFGLKIHLIYS